MKYIRISKVMSTFKKDLPTLSHLPINFTLVISKYHESSEHLPNGATGLVYIIHSNGLLYFCSVDGANVGEVFCPITAAVK